MNIANIIKNSNKPLFSFEVLPPLKGKGLEGIFGTIDPLLEFNPQFINITTHCEQYDKNGKRTRKRPGTVAVAATIKNKYNIPVVPHILCGGFTREETEYVLIDLDYLGIENLLVLRGDGRNKENYQPEVGGNRYAVDLLRQINDMNHGKYIDDEQPNSSAATNFHCGVAGYPEKHYSATSLDEDILNLKAKVDAGAQYIVTQMFFDNQKYYDFVEKCRNVGITVPIIPGIKPIGFMSQVDVLPKIFACHIPTEFETELRKCKCDADAAKVGTEWAIYQANELAKYGVPLIHWFTYSDPSQVVEIAKAIY
ncbi:MAG: methylenetetrahydrofolate reductase [Bacteroidales bacterium]|nr:methylenetetrahydrofolate reductase [Bacteroidales bacterium]